MPKNDDTPALAVCDGCGMEAADVSEEPNAAGYHYCDRCADIRKGDPTVYVQGRTLLVSELKAQAEDDEHMAAALGGDTVQEALKAAKKQ